jgi:tRNA dimethylallyltransferase
MPKPLRIIFLLGCTGCGKGALGRQLALRMGGEIISVDSMKVYRGMDIGTAKPGPEDRRLTPHHLIDVVEPHEEFSVADFIRLAEAAAGDIASRSKAVLAVGGTGLYIKALSEGVFDGPSADPDIRTRLQARAEREGTASLHDELCRVDPEAGARIHRNDLRRLVRALEVYELTGEPISALQTQWDQQRTRHDCRFIGIRRALEDQNRRTNARVRRLIDRGWVDEVRRLTEAEKPISRSARQALGYPELIQHVEGELSLEDAVEKIKIATRQFAKAQRTWFKRFRSTHWFDLSSDEKVEVTADRALEHLGRACST